MVSQRDNNAAEYYGPLIQRGNIMSRIKAGLERSGLAIIVSPNGSGKSTLLRLIESEDLMEDAVYLYVKFSKDKPAFKTVKSTGLSYHPSENTWTCKKANIKNRNVVVFLDDAQFQYEDELFWSMMFKCGSGDYPMLPRPKKIYFIISCTYLLEDPLYLRSANCLFLTLKDMKMSKDQSNEFVDSTVMGLSVSM